MPTEDRVGLGGGGQRTSAEDSRLTPKNGQFGDVRFELREIQLDHAVTVNIRGTSYRLKDKLKSGLVQAATEAAG